MKQLSELTDPGYVLGYLFYTEKRWLCPLAVADALVNVHSRAREARIPGSIEPAVQAGLWNQTGMNSNPGSPSWGDFGKFINPSELLFSYAKGDEICFPCWSDSWLLLTYETCTPTGVTYVVPYVIFVVSARKVQDVLWLKQRSNNK